MSFRTPVSCNAGLASAVAERTVRSLSCLLVRPHDFLCRSTHPIALHAVATHSRSSCNFACKACFWSVRCLSSVSPWRFTYVAWTCALLCVGFLGSSLGLLSFSAVIPPVCLLVCLRACADCVAVLFFHAPLIFCQCSLPMPPPSIPRKK